MNFKIFLLWTFVLIGRPQDLFPILQPLRPALVLTLVSTVFTFCNTTEGTRSYLLRTSEFKKYLLFFAIMIAGIPFAYHRKVAFDSVFPLYLVNMLFFVIFIIQVDSYKKLKDVLLIICTCVFFYSVFSLKEGTFSHERFYTYGSMYDPNDIAYVLISLLPMSLFFVVSNDGLFKKIFAITATMASLATILLTGSRGGMLGIIAVFILLLFTKTGGIKMFYKISFVLCIIPVLMFYGDKMNKDRYLSLTEINNDYNLTETGGRIDIWKKSGSLFMSNPIIGIGTNCFPMAIGYYRESLNLEDRRWQAVHNSYIQIAVEMGVFGISVFVLLMISCFRIFSKCKRLVTVSFELTEIKTIAGLLQAGFVGSLVCAFFLSQGYSLLFTLYFAFSATLRKLTDNLPDNSVGMPSE